MAVRCSHTARAMVAAFALFAAGACGPSADQAGGQGGTSPDVLVFAAIPSEESTTLEQSYQHVIALLEKETGRSVEFQQATDYSAVIEGQRSGKIHIAKYGPLSYVLARDTGAHVTAVAAELKEKGGKPGYHSYGVVKADSPIRTLADLAGKKVCFTDPTSTSGYLYPRAALLDIGIDPETELTTVLAGGHDAAALSVASGQCDAGFAGDVLVDELLIAKGQLEPGEIRKVWTSDLIPGSVVAVSDQLDESLRGTIADTFQRKANVDYLRANGYCTGECPVDNSHDWGYATVNDASYDGVRAVCAATKTTNCSS
jgi:phosphonate transport system substrate-binding protein